MNYDLKFNGDYASVICSCCHQRTDVKGTSDVIKNRLDWVFSLILASTRTQGYHSGYLCRKCEKKNGVDTKGVRKFCKNKLTTEFFKNRENIKVVS